MPDAAPTPPAIQMTAEQAWDLAVAAHRASALDSEAAHHDQRAAQARQRAQAVRDKAFVAILDAHKVAEGDRELAELVRDVKGRVTTFRIVPAAVAAPAVPDAPAPAEAAS